MSAIAFKFLGSCEGRCMRSFHATEASGEGLCESLGLSDAQISALPNFFCKNCQYEQHQCFICGMLGSSDISSNPEVFPCVAANCGRFYHPKCVAEELQKRNGCLVEALEQKIAGGESFACPAHRCFVCKQVEDRKFKDMQFAVCRRCPKSYHRKCLPREIAFEADYEKNILQRAWDNLLPKRILIYCLDHEIRPDLGTPERNHLCFPGSDKERKAALATSGNVAQRKRKLIASQSSAEDVLQNTAKQDEKVDFSFRESDSARLVGKSPCRPGLDSHRKRSSCNSASVSMVHEKISQKAYGSSTVTGVKKMHDNSKLTRERSLQQYSQKPGNVGISCMKLNTVGLVKKGCSSPVSDPEMEKRIIALMKDVDSSFDVNEFIKKQKVPLIYKNSPDMLDKTVTMGKVEVAVKAVQTALQKLKNGGTVDDAKAVCSPEMLRQIPLWKRKLEIYLGPFLHGMCYSSYGRHFTNLEKLQEIVDRLHWYVQDGDMIVDFCCGANDFSHLMKAKLDSVGKKNCSFKNYDLFPTKNDFNFEQRDWFTVTPGELPRGPQLIMGLNPPFGVKGALANKFISHALQFDPKLMILIVPPETQRLDRRRDGKNYDLIWEDRCLLSGKSFYLPGSVDIHGKQVLQWNNSVPLLSLWSRPKWTAKSRAIARRQHPSLLPGHLPLSAQTSTWNYLMNDQHDCYNDFSNLMNQGGDLNHMLDDVPEPNDECIPGRGKQLWGNVLSFDNRDTSFSPLDLEDMDISPANSPIRHMF